MTLRPLKTAALFALLAAPAVMHAQAEISSSEEQRLEALVREQAEIYTPRNSVTVGFRVLNSGAKVNFNKLGTVGFATIAAPKADGAVNRLYDNGSVSVDELRGDEKDADGIQTSTPGGRYNVTGGDRLSYTPGLTRIWSYRSTEQAGMQPGYIAMSSYSAVSDGGSFAKKQGPTSGVELQFSRLLGKVTGRIQWSFIAGISLYDINSKTSGDVQSTLRTSTDYYSLNGLTAPALTTVTDPTTGVVTTIPYTGPSYVDVTTPDGAVIPNGHETTVPVSNVPSNDEHIVTDTAGAATVHGRWQVKGAYFLVKVGPSLRTQITERLGVSASLGLAGAYSGTHYSVAESFEVPVIGTTLTTPATEQSDASKFLSGYYADLNLEWAANATTGLFGGVTAQKLGDYEQSVGNRNARIDLGSSVGVRGGISIRF